MRRIFLISIMFLAFLNTKRLLELNKVEEISAMEITDWGEPFTFNNTDDNVIGDLTTLTYDYNKLQTKEETKAKIIENEKKNDNLETNEYKDYIYFKESSYPEPGYDSVHMHDPSTNVYGICQIDLDLYDVSKYNDFYNSFEAQDDACTDYMLNRYGSWEKAYNFHVMNGWW